MATVYAGQYGPEAVEFPDGSHAVAHSVFVRTTGGSLATLYADRHRVGSLNNPAVTDDLGNLTFHAEPGRYVLAVGDWTIPVIVPEDPSEPDTTLSPEDRESLAEDIGQDVLEGLEPPVTLTLLFENALV